MALLRYLVIKATTYPDKSCLLVSKRRLEVHKVHTQKDFYIIQYTSEIYMRKNINFQQNSYLKNKNQKAVKNSSQNFSVRAPSSKYSSHTDHYIFCIAVSGTIHICNTGVCACFRGLPGFSEAVFCRARLFASSCTWKEGIVGRQGVKHVLFLFRRLVGDLHLI